MRALEVTGLEKRFRSNRRTVEAVKWVSLHLEAGEILAFLGPNGAGKTTTIKIIAGLLRPDAGKVRIAGRDPHQDASALRQVGAVLEGNRNIYWRLTPEENIQYFGVLRGMKPRDAARRAAELLERFGLGAKRNVPTQHLSRGMQQQVALAVALAHDPQLLLLDEPTLGLDVAASERIKALVKQAAEGGQAVLLTSHQLAMAEQLATRVMIIHEGQVATEGVTAELVERYSKDLYRVELAETVNGHRQEALARLGVSLDGTVVEFPGGEERLYRVLDALRPAPILRVERIRPSLSDIFLDVTGATEPLPAAGQTVGATAS